MRIRIVLASVLTVSAVVTVGAIAGASSSDSTTAESSASSAARGDVLADERGRVEYPAALVESSVVVAGMYGEADPVGFSEERGPTVYVARADLVRMITAQRARTRELPYSEADMLAPARYESGELAGYVSNAGLLTPEEVLAPTFDLCAREVQMYRDALVKAREDGRAPSDLPEATTERVAELFHCSPA